MAYTLFLEALTLRKTHYYDILEYVKNNSVDWNEEKKAELQRLYENYKNSLEVEKYCPCY